MVECLAVDGRMRGRGLGSSLVAKIELEARAKGVTKLWAVARKPEFFEKNGYLRTSGGERDGPSLKDCASCNQYLRTCSPAIMLKLL
jgi:N-acetylglutamate synthase-like GNAT family acetyltransferase